MDNNISALQNLYVAMGGNIEDVENITIIPDMINAVATAFQGAAEFMMTPLIVEVIEDGGSYSADVAYSEIAEAYQNGKRIVLKMTIGETVGYAELQGLMGSSFVFVADDFAHDLHYVAAIYDNDGTPAVILKAYTLTAAE